MQIKLNAYNVLGLETLSTYREVNKRHKELEKYLNIQEIPSYEADIALLDYSEIRTIDGIKEAFENLSQIQSQLREFFFWFNINDLNDEKAFKNIKENNYEKALKEWKYLYETDTTSRRLFYAKNFLVLLFLQVEESTEIVVQDIEDTVGIWKEIMDSSHFWRIFSEYFECGTETKLNETILNLFKEDIKKNLSSLYIQIWESIDSYSLYWKFSSTFNITSSTLDHSIMTDIYDKISSSVELLESLGISSDWIFDDDEKQIVKESVTEIQDALNQTEELWFFEDSKILLLRDRAGKAIRTIVLDIYNNLYEWKKSLWLLKIAHEISGTQSVKEKILEDLNQIENNIDFSENEEFIDQLVSLFKNGKSDAALAKIDEILGKSNTSEDLRKNLLELKNSHLDRIKKHGKIITSAPGSYTINWVWVRIYGDTRYIVFLYIPIFPIDRFSLKDLWESWYEFYWKLELTKIQVIWRNLVLFGVVLWIIIALVIS